MTAQVNTGVVALREDAQTRADMIRAEFDSLVKHLENAVELLMQALREQDHVALGYDSWGDYVHAQLGTHLLKLDKTARRALTRQLTSAGMSTRQIAPITNVSKATAARDAASTEASQASGDEPTVIDGEVVSDTADASKALDKLRTAVERAQTGIDYLTNHGTLPADLSAEQAEQWHAMICGKRGKGNAGLAKQLHSFADKLSEAYSLK